MSGWTIAPATPHDAPDLAAFGARTFMDTFGHLYPQADKDFFLAQRFSLDRTLADIATPGRQIRLARDPAGALAGFSDAGPMGLPYLAAAAGSVELYRLYLDEPAKGTGLAARMMGDFLDWARAVQAPEAYLGVYHANARAQAFYRRYGFAIVAAYQFPVGQTLDDERIMRLPLTGGA